MTLQTPPTVPNPSNMATFDSLAYPFAKWIKNTASITDTTVVLGQPLKKQTWYGLTSPYNFGDIRYAAGSGAISANQTYYVPIFVTSDVLITALCFGVYAIVSTHNVKVGIANDVNGVPNGALSVSTLTSISSTGKHEIQIPPIELKAGNMYWVGINHDNENTFTVYSSDVYLTAKVRIALGTSFTDPQTCAGYKVVEGTSSAFTTFTSIPSFVSVGIIQKGTLI